LLAKIRLQISHATPIEKYSWFYYVSFSLIGVIWFFNLFIDIMDIDAAQYAAISREMFETKSFVEVYLRGEDYLDKPPLLFWLSSLSFYIFGVSNFAYKLPSVLVLLLGVYSTYKFALIYYSAEKAKLAALILASSQAILLISNDIRTDTTLVGFVIFSVWQLTEFIRNNKNKNLILASLGVGLAMLAKGPIGFVLPFMGVGLNILVERNWKALFNVKWLLLVLIVGVILLPMCIGLYHQFDLHPEKTVYGLEGPSGLRFYFWTQSFGRLTGENYWKDDTTFFYFFHTILWDFQPWIILFAMGLVAAIFGRFRKNNFALPELVSVFNFVLGFIALSKSNYKLPHYIFPLLPFAAVITSHFLHEMLLKKRWLKILFWKQAVLTTLFYIIIVLSYYYFFDVNNYFVVLAVVVSLIAHIYFIFVSKWDHLKRLVAVSVVSFIMFGFNTSLYFYPQVLSYQAGGPAGRYIVESGISADHSYFYGFQFNSLDFYSQRIMKELELDNVPNLPTESLIFTDNENAQKIISLNSNFKPVNYFDQFSVTRLNFRFLIKDSRSTKLEKYVILMN